jgi:hypothetical protein
MVFPLLKVIDNTVTTLPDLKHFPLTLTLAVDNNKKIYYSEARKVRKSMPAKRQNRIIR